MSPETHKMMMLVGHKECADEDDELFQSVLVVHGRFHMVSTAVNPDDEEDEPVIMLFGPFDTEREAQNCFRRMFKGRGRKFGDWDVLSDAMREKIERYVSRGAHELEKGRML